MITLTSVFYFDLILLLNQLQKFWMNIDFFAGSDAFFQESGLNPFGLFFNGRHDLFLKFR